MKQLEQLHSLSNENQITYILDVISAWEDITGRKVIKLDIIPLLTKYDITAEDSAYILESLGL